MGIVVCIIALAGMTSGVLYEKRFGASHHPVISNLGQCGAGLIFVFPIAWIGMALAGIGVTIATRKKD